jgi:RNA ligase
MEKLEKVDWNILNTYIDNNFIIANKHSEYDIWILNYSPKAQFKKFWDIYTMSCRGLIVDADGNILARPFQKFKNYEEHDPSEIDMTQDFEIFEKVDGSLIILFYYKLHMQWIIASRGSFISEQALEAKKMIDSNTYDILNKENTYIFEILYPENQIVVNYGRRRELVLLTRIETLTGNELYYDDLVSYYSNYFTIVKKYNIKNIKELDELKKLEENNREGFVVKFANGFRVKIKFDSYVKIHSIVTNVSNLSVWENLMNNSDFDVIVNNVPDEFKNWLEKTVNKLQSEFNDIERLSLIEFIRIYYNNNIVDRKEFALEALKSEYRSILFKIYNKQSYDKIIWKMIKPIFSRPFRDGY